MEFMSQEFEENLGIQSMITQSLPMVHHVARRIHVRLPQHVEFDDLVSAGTVGLIEAFMKFKPDKNVGFRAFASFRVRGAILDSLRMLDWGPRELRRQGRAVDEATHVLAGELWRSPSEAEVASKLGLSIMKFQTLRGELSRLVLESLNEIKNDTGEEKLALVPCLAEENPLFRCIQGDLADRLAVAISHLPGHEPTVLRLHYLEDLNLSEIGLALGLSRARISQIRASGLSHLRCSLEKSGIGGTS